MAFGSKQELPLTRSQLMIWTGQNLQPNDPLYNMVLTFRLRGPVDEACFSRAFRQLVANCDALRTTFTSKSGVPKQIVHEMLDCPVNVVELSERAAGRWIRTHAQQRFDLSKCLFESALLRLSDEDHVWFFNQHHLTTDAWSTSLIFNYVGQYYRLALDGRLDEASVPPAFSEYVEYETAQRESKALQRAQSYWEQQLQAPYMPSSFFRPTPAGRSGRTLRVACNIGSERSERIRAAARLPGFKSLTENMARFHLFATCLLAWLYRITGNTTVTIGTPNHNRGTTRFKKTVGLFIEMYPLRVEIGEDESFQSLFAKVARTSTEMLMHAPSGASSFSHNRAFDVVLNYITATFGDFDGMPVESQWVHADHGDRNHLLRMQVEDFDNADEFRVFFDLNEDTFVDGELEKPGEQLVRLLDAFLQRPGQAIAGVDILAPDERERLLDGYASASDCKQSECTVLQMFLEQAQRFPDSPAISGDGEVLTYSQLKQRAECQAGTLQAAGVTKRDRVAIAVPRSTDAVISILGVLRLGAAYVPIDASYPAARIAGMIEDAGIRWLVASADSGLDAPPGVAVIDLSAAAESPENLPDPAELSASESAYVIFTSGSTGRPKGVEVSHGSLANYVSWAARFYLDDRSLDWPLFSSLSFDLTVTSIFVPLVTGGRIVVYPESNTGREITIRRVIEDNEVDIVKLTPAHLSLLQTMDLSQSKIGKLVVGGENLKSDLARSISSYFGDRVEIYNEYGPTEGTVACMIHRFDPSNDRASSVPVGRAIDNAYVYVLNEHRELQPEGVVGELYIGGEGVARGYVGRPDLTAERFVNNPFRDGETMYRTGDLARANPDGTLSCLGRVDEQFKLNGIRMEPGEIEAAMLEHPQISSCAVKLITRSASEDVDDAAYCVRCGLSALHPDAMLDDASVCHICRVYEDEKDRAQSYFRTLDDLRIIVEQAREGARGEQDCMMLLSGGKDSTYALCQLVELGLTPLVFTLDNGFISDGAKANMRRVVDELGLELVEGSTAAMNEIFVDSLHRFSNVCNGCFKTIYTLSMRIARERGIRHIFTGLSRGQIFETRVADLFRQRIFDPATIDKTIIEARKAYHHAHDAVTENLDCSHFDDDSIFEEIQFVDFYRYTNVSLDTMLAYLRDRVPWVRPADTGRSTNCLINEAGIYVHKKERRYHNYSLPYSWDVRLGHKERDAAREELDDDINLQNVDRILKEIGYKPRESGGDKLASQLLVGYYIADRQVDEQELASTLARRLPDDFVPSRFMRIDELPLTPNGKLDREALPEPDILRPEFEHDYVAPGTPVESTLAAIWADVIGVDRVGVNDNFFDLGGDSIMNIQIVAAAGKRGIRLSPQQVFDHPTVRELALVVGNADEIASQQGPVTGQVPLTPIQRDFLSRGLERPETYCQYILLRLPEPPDTLALQEAMRLVMLQHDALRAQFTREGNDWTQVFAEPGRLEVPVQKESISSVARLDDDLARIVHRMQQELDLTEGPLLKVAAIGVDDSSESFLLLLASHLVVDAVSWWIIVEDLEQAYSSLIGGNPVRLGAKTTSMPRWSQALSSFARSEAAINTLPLWNSAGSTGRTSFSVDDGLAGDNCLDDVGLIRTILDRRTTKALLTGAIPNWRLQPQELLLSAFAFTISEWTGQKELIIDMEGHGRELISDDIDLLRTVGWFTSVYPVRISIEDTEDTATTLLAVKRRMREIPNGGIAYGALRYMSESSEIAASLGSSSPAPFLFNYLGQWRRDLSPEASMTFARPVGAAYGANGPRQYIFEVNAAVFEGKLQIEWTFGKNLHRRQTVQQLAERFREMIREITQFCATNSNDSLAPSDFPDAGLSESELTEIFEEFGED